MHLSLNYKAYNIKNNYLQNKRQKGKCVLFDLQFKENKYFSCVNFKGNIQKEGGSL